MIEARNLIKTFVRNEDKNVKKEFNAVDDISFSVKDGEIVGLIGPNGAGKTTLLRMTATLMRPTSGTLTYEAGGRVITDPVEIKRHIGYLSGNTRLYRRMSVRELMEMFGCIYGMEKEKIDERISEISKTLDMDSFIDNRIERLSTGQTQRASISRCLIHDPEVYIFDEPTLGLDIISSNAIIEFMRGEKEKGKTIIYSTHYMEETQYLCDRIIMISKGRIIRDFKTEDILAATGASNIREAFNQIIREEELQNEE